MIGSFALVVGCVTVGVSATVCALHGWRVALAEHLLAMKVLSMRDARLQDRINAPGLLATGPVDIAEVRRLFSLIEARDFG